MQPLYLYILTCKIDYSSATSLPAHEPRVTSVQNRVRAASMLRWCVGRSDVDPTDVPRANDQAQRTGQPASHFLIPGGVMASQGRCRERSGLYRPRCRAARCYAPWLEEYRRCATQFRPKRPRENHSGGLKSWWFRNVHGYEACSWPRVCSVGRSRRRPNNRRSTRRAPPTGAHPARRGSTS